MKRAVAALPLLAILWTSASVLASVTADAATEARLQALLGAERRLRDYAPFVTERGEAAKLLLFVTGAIDPPENATLDPDAMTCPEMVQGIPLRGTYHVGLVIRGKLINEVAIPGVRDYAQPPGPTCCLLALPLKNTARWNYNVWGAGRPTESNHIEPTKLMRLADFNGDGHAWEFRLVQPGSCSDDITLLAGYSPAQRKAIIFPILEHGGRGYWEDNLFPHPVKPNARRVRWVLHCGDHGAEKEEERIFVYDPRREAWVLTRERVKACDP